MDITLKDYRRGAELKFVLKDVPATIMPKAIDLFAMLLDETTEKQDAEPRVGLPNVWRFDMTGEPTRCYGMTENAPGPDGNPQSANTPEEPPKRRGRPKKDAATSPAVVEMQVETQENVEAMAKQMHGAPASESPLSEEALPAEVLVAVVDTTETASAPDAEAGGSTPLAEITDTELQRYCAKIAQHFGGPKPVMDLAAPFVPEGAVVRPSNIRDNAARWAFIRAAEEASGMKYHG